MTKAAAFAATYADFRLVRGRKVAVVALEIPIEQAEAFVAAFGLPNPASETWVALARLAQEPGNLVGVVNVTEREVSEPAPVAAPAPASAPEPPAERRPFKNLLPAQQAGIACNELRFRRYLVDERMAPQTVLDDPEEAAIAVRHLCGVDSRRDLKPGTAAARKWAEIHTDFQMWMRT